MIEYLKTFIITTKEYDYICDHLDSELILNLTVMQDNVCEVLQFLTSLGVKNLIAVLLYRPDLCFRDIDTLKEQFMRVDPQLLVNIINHNIDDLVCFSI